MVRGFTLIELLITVVILAIIVSTALPNLSAPNESINIKRASNELQAFLANAKMEAVMRNDNLWIHIINENDTDWELKLMNTSDQSGFPIQSLFGKEYKNITLDSTYGQNNLFIDGATGRLDSGHFLLYPRGKEAKSLKIITFYTTGRVRSCGVNGAYYGLLQC